MFQAALGRVSAGQDLGFDEMADVIDLVMQGNCDEQQVGLLLTALRAKGETVAEVAGAAAAMRRHMVRISSDRQGIVDTCGTGGDGSGTFNISTAAALVAAAAGVPVAKHGNRKITSKSGSADVLVELGVNVEAPLDTVRRCLDELGICFCFAPQLHPAMRHVAVIRRKLGVPTIFNMLGPLSNPADAPFQLLGVGQAALRPLLAEALQQLGTVRALVVRGEDGLDELTLNGVTHVSEVHQSECRSFDWDVEQFGLSRQPLDTLAAEGPVASAAIIRRVLSGEPGPARDIVVLNAAAALWTAGAGASPTACAQLAAEGIDSGRARELLQQLADLSQS